MATFLNDCCNIPLALIAPPQQVAPQPVTSHIINIYVRQ